MVCESSRLLRLSWPAVTHQSRWFVSKAASPVPTCMWCGTAERARARRCAPRCPGALRGRHGAPRVPGVTATAAPGCLFCARWCWWAQRHAVLCTQTEVDEVSGKAGAWLRVCSPRRSPFWCCAPLRAAVSCADGLAST